MTERVDLEELTRRATCADFGRLNLRADTLLALIAELTELRAQAGGWVAVAPNIDPVDEALIDAAMAKRSASLETRPMREHRALAAKALDVDGRQVERWVADGVASTAHYDDVTRIARAISDAEVRGVTTALDGLEPLLERTGRNAAALGLVRSRHGAAAKPLPGAVNCGEGRTVDGCGESKPYAPSWKGDDNVAYRCLDCGVAFCKWCLKKHFEASKLPKPPEATDG